MSELNCIEIFSIQRYILPYREVYIIFNCPHSGLLGFMIKNSI